MAAVLAQLARQVYSVEIIAALEEWQPTGFTGFSVMPASRGFHPNSPITKVPPPLVEQLKPGARLVIPVGMPGGVQELKVVEKDADGSITSRNILLVAFVPLTRAATGSDRQET